jgi:hypothetical protein
MKRFVLRQRPHAESAIGQSYKLIIFFCQSREMITMPPWIRY